MRLLLDTHAFLWWDGAPEHMGPRARAACLAPGNELILPALPGWRGTMKHELFARVALRAPLGQHRLRTGDVATVVDYHPGGPGQEPGYTLEVFNAVGDTLAVVTVRESQIDPLTTDEVLHVRRLEEAAV